MEGKKKFDEKRNNNIRNNRKGRNQNKQQANKLTPQEQVNQQVLQKYLDTLFKPKKRVSTGAGGKISKLDVVYHLLIYQIGRFTFIGYNCSSP